MKKCPYCAEEIQVAAVVCWHCGRDLRPRKWLRRGVSGALVVGLLSWFFPFAPHDSSAWKWLRGLFGGRKDSPIPSAGTTGGQGLATDASSSPPEVDPASTDLGAVAPLPADPQTGEGDPPAVPPPIRSATSAPIPADASASETPSGPPPLSAPRARFRRPADPEPVLPGAVETEIPLSPLPVPISGAESAVPESPERPHTSNSYQEGIVVAVARIEIKRHATPLGTLYSPTVPRGFYLGGCKLTLGVAVDPSGHAVVEEKEVLGQISPFVIARAVQIVEHTRWSPALDQDDQPVADTLLVVFRWD